MSYLLCYTKQGADHYRDVNDSMHLALTDDRINYEPLRNNTGVLFPKADLNDGTLPGCSKTLLYPWLFRFADGSGGVIAVRRNKENRPDTRHIGAAIIYQTEDFVRYRELGFLKLAETEIKSPRCVYDTEKQSYQIQWMDNGRVYSGCSKDLQQLDGAKAIPSFTLTAQTKAVIPLGDFGNELEISAEEAKEIRRMLSVVCHVENRLPEVKIPVGDTLTAAALPKAECIYSDGSTHEKTVCWDADAIARADTGKPGIIEIPGKIQLKTYPVPFITHASDPCVFNYCGKYYFTSSNKQVILRESDTIDGLMTTDKIVIYEDPVPKTSYWAQELHLVEGTPYIFTSRCTGGDWTTVESVVFKCNGSINKPSDWEGPIYVLKKDGSLLMETGISLDMTYFTLGNRHYVSWSNREMNPERDHRNEGGTNGTADIYIAEIAPEIPWKLISDPVCISRADYGWSRLEVDVEEGPYLLRRGDDLFLSISGAGCSTVYCLGLLHAKYGSDLLDPASWDKVPYPLLTRESVPGQHGPGHNNFFKDPENGVDDWMALLYRPLSEGFEAMYETERFSPRNAALRRVHWNANGYPNFEMYPERDLSPELTDVLVEVVVS